MTTPRLDMEPNMAAGGLYDLLIVIDETASMSQYLESPNKSVGPRHCPLLVVDWMLRPPGRHRPRRLLRQPHHLAAPVALLRRLGQLGISGGACLRIDLGPAPEFVSGCRRRPLGLD